MEFKKVKFADGHSMVVTEGVESSKLKVVPVLRRNAEGEPLPKQHYSADTPRPTPSMVGTMDYMPLPRHEPSGVLNRIPRKDPRAKKKTASKSNKVARLNSYVVRYSHLTELAGAPSGITVS